MIYPVVLNPCLDRSIFIEKIELNQVIRASKVRLDWGGKGNNVARALHVLGIPCEVHGFSGGITGEIMEAELRAYGIRTNFIRIKEETRTNYVFNELDGEHYLKVNEIGPTISAKEQGLFLDKVRLLNQPGDIWVFSGRLPPGVPVDYYAQCIYEIQKRGGRGFLDTSGEALKHGCRAAPYLVKPNLTELEELIGCTLTTRIEKMEAIQQLIASGIRLVVVSDGGGELFFATQTEIFQIKPQAVNVRNVIGAGDSLMAGVLFGLYHELPLDLAARWSLACGTASVMNEQVGIVNRKEVEDVFMEMPTSPLLSEPAKEVLPGLLFTSEKGSFAQHTIVERKPKIIERILGDNRYSEEVTRKIDQFANEIKNETISPVTDVHWDAPIWNSEIQKYAGKSWLEIPWFFVEALFYRRILNVTGYYSDGGNFLRDPFQQQKTEQITSDIRQIEKEWQNYPDIESEIGFSFLLHASLWGNRADLSNITVKLSDHKDIAGRDEDHLILVDDTDAVYKIVSPGVKRVDFIADNAGRELIYDLILADYLLRAGLVEQVIIHLKASPFFVSDAMIKDATLSIEALSKSRCDGIHQVGKRLTDWEKSGKLVLKDNPFWSGFSMFDRLPLLLNDDLSKSNLIFVKGDANYRRILGDRHWNFTMPIEEINNSFPRPFVLLRTFKAEIAAGLNQKTVNELSASDPDWLVNGKRGVIQLIRVDS